MADISIRITGQEAVERKLKEIPGELYQDAKAAMRKTLGGLHQEMVRRSGGGEGGLKGRTGELKRSWRFDVQGSDINTLQGKVESVGVPYAAIHEFGGVIRAKKAKWLTIPTKYNQTPAGVTRMTARMVIDQGGFFAKNIIFFKRPGTKRPIPMFIMKKQVTIPARLGFREQAEIYGKQLLADLNNILER